MPVSASPPRTATEVVVAVPAPAAPVRLVRLVRWFDPGSCGGDEDAVRSAPHLRLPWQVLL